MVCRLVGNRSPRGFIPGDSLVSKVSQSSRQCTLLFRKKNKGVLILVQNSSLGTDKDATAASSSFSSLYATCQCFGYCHFGRDSRRRCPRNLGSILLHAAYTKEWREQQQQQQQSTTNVVATATSLPVVQGRSGSRRLGRRLLATIATIHGALCHTAQRIGLGDEHRVLLQGHGTSQCRNWMVQ